MSFTKMYLVTEAEFHKLKKPFKLAQDAQVVANSLMAVSQKRKKQGIAASLPRIQLRKYNVDAGVRSMKDEDVTKPLRRGRTATVHSTPSRHRQHAPHRTSIFGTPAAELSMLRH